MKRAFAICGTVVATVFIAGTAAVDAQTPAAEPTAAPVAEGTANRTPPFKKEELEAILAPIALYPDALLAQIFMASTYPLEIVEAARWSKAHPEVKGDAVAGAVQSQTWDPSVKSLCAFPTVLEKMNEKIDWTQKLGDAFLAQQKEVMQAVQVLRGKAKDTGNLKSSKEVIVKEEPAPAGSPAPQTIIIESPDPEVIQVPVYNTSVVYGSWGYPYYPPYSYYPPGYAYGAAFWSFTAGVIVGGAIWGNCNWGGNDVDIDINRQNNFNRNEINTGDRNRNNVNSNNRGNNNRAGNNSGNRQSWSHNSEHRKGVGYRDTATQQKFNRGSNQQAAQAREQYRGRAEQGRQQISREGAGNQRDLSGNRVGTSDRSAGTRDMGGASTRDLSSGTRDLGGNNAGTRDLGGASTRDLGSSSSNRDVGGSRDSSSRNYGGSSSRSSSSRGSSSAFGGSSRSSGSSTRMSSSRGGMSRGGGGGGRRR
ncbi:MAG TPA: DUF3300 domain-containing protein [Steroidobacteraceae bacterium]|nr:DUF3300 domain-containing protein [Steroidobacteraceae bacterium]